MSRKVEYIFGVHTVTSVIKSKSTAVKKIFFADSNQINRLKEIVALAKRYGIAIETVQKRTLDKLADSDMHQGVVAEFVNIAETLTLEEYLASQTLPPFLLILDGVQDPHNLGACLRTAEAAGIQAVIIPENNSVGITAVVRKVACGAAEVLPVFRVKNMARTLGQLKERGVWLVGAAMEGEQTVFAADLRGPLGIVLGAEGTGLRRLTAECCDSLVRIPMVGTVASLNVSVATGVFLFEALRQRGYNPEGC